MIGITNANKESTLIIIGLDRKEELMLDELNQNGCILRIRCRVWWVIIALRAVFGVVVKPKSIDLESDVEQPIKWSVIVAEWRYL